MKISTKFGGMMLVIVLLTGFLMFFTITSINSIKDITMEHQNSNTPLMITALSFQKDVIQISSGLPMFRQPAGCRVLMMGLK